MELSRDDPASIEPQFGELFLDTHPTAPTQIILDLGARGDPLHANQPCRGEEILPRHYDTSRICGSHILRTMRLLAATLRGPNIDTDAHAVEEIASVVRQIRRAWPRVRILLRAGSGFWQQRPIRWREANRVKLALGLESAAAEIELIAMGDRSVRRFHAFACWTPRRRGRRLAFLRCPTGTIPRGRRCNGTIATRCACSRPKNPDMIPNRAERSSQTIVPPGVLS